MLIPDILCNFTLFCFFFFFPLHSKRGFDVRSFGTGSHVKLPGPAPDKPNVYDFKTTYEQMYNDLVRKDKELYPLFPFSLPPHTQHTYMLLVCEQCRNCSASSNTHTGKLSGFQKNCTFCLMSVQNSNTTAVLV